MANPVLHNGMGSPQSIYVSGATQHHKVGTRGSLSDGRVFYYARNSGAALVAGNLLMAEIVSGDMDNLAVTASAAGQKVVNVTPVGTKTFAANALEGGYMTINDSGATAEDGHNFAISGNPATTAATAFNVTLKDDLPFALTTAAQVTISKNPWMDAVIAAGAQAHLPVGVPQIAVALGSTTPQFYWCQTWGVSAGWDDDTTAIGAGLTSGTTAGQFEIVAATDASIGIQLFTGVATEYYPKFLQIAP